jgi:glycosyltransferase involved in cell wall biosynthesis
MEMSNEPLVSVVIPVHNGERYLADAIQSVLSQSYRPLEIIVVDDGSLDTTAEVVGEYPEVGYVYQDHQGVSVARNRGLDEAKGELITFLDHDDILLPDSIRRRVEYMKNHSGVWCLISKHRSYLEQDVNQAPWIPEVEFTEGSYGFGYLMARRSVLAALGGFDPEYRTGELMDLFFRAEVTNYTIGKFPEITVLRRVHGKNLSRNVKAMRVNLLQSARATIQRKRQLREKEDEQ